MTDTIRTGTPARWRSMRRASASGRLARAEAGLAQGGADCDSAPGGGEFFVFALGSGRVPGGNGLPPGTALCPNIDLHHDGDAAALDCVADKAADRAGALTIACGAFGGSYLSLAASVPEAVAHRFGPGRVLRLSLAAQTSRPLTTFLRLNIGSADGHEVFYETIVVHRGRRCGTFDLDGVRLPFDGRLHAWTDIIFSRPDHAEIALSELRLSLVGKEAL